MIIYDRDGHVTLKIVDRFTQQARTLDLADPDITRVQVAAWVAGALGDRVFWLDQAPPPEPPPPEDRTLEDRIEAATTLEELRQIRQDISDGGGWMTASTYLTLMRAQTRLHE